MERNFYKKPHNPEPSCIIHKYIYIQIFCKGSFLSPHVLQNIGRNIYVGVQGSSLFDVLLLRKIVTKAQIGHWTIRQNDTLCFQWGIYKSLPEYLLKSCFLLIINEGLVVLILLRERQGVHWIGHCPKSVQWVSTELALLDELGESLLSTNFWYDPSPKYAL